MGIFSKIGKAFKKIGKAVKKIASPVFKIGSVAAGFVTGGLGLAIGGLAGKVADKFKQIQSKHKDSGAEKTAKALWNLQKEYPSEAKKIEAEAIKAGLANLGSGAGNFLKNPIAILAVGALLFFMFSRKS